ncbi:hypothetical protein SO802_018176 [Lithocarpus litseifolius]|uniref:Uncharacterized protein n=1 Tax=Lithocarpus litseifolius TaxID=425828 RepID=A0AAW2CKL3_9ROSI
MSAIAVGIGWRLIPPSEGQQDHKARELGRLQKVSVITHPYAPSLGILLGAYGTV